MAVGALEVDVGAGPGVLGECVATGEANGARGHPGHPGRRRRAGGAYRRGRRRREPDGLDLELGPRRLDDHICDPLADLRRRAVHLSGELATRRTVEAHARGRVVVEALRVTDVLEADGETDPAPDTLTACRVPRAARKPERIARQLLGLGDRQVGT